ncbi:hypothetical protein [Frigidibacter sp. ROC022]|uniref:hypothetical protein n=1 Tax=Frigidibacter sp. ROC022 TaxID=2971796 RepID=UPI00215B6585|nr:hypothetical protein [Frigidibacter sp. ROC022]MCR8723667.1 hypothetical protein [Frigidibacter sp. ROC022]
MKLILPLLLVLALNGCETKAPEDDGLLGGPVPADAAAQKEACEKSGGRWGRGGLGDFNVCYRNTRDGGKSCSAGSDCEGLCLARSRTCAPVIPLFGCQDILGDNGQPGTICID